MSKETGQVNWLREEDGTYMLDAWVPPPQQGSSKTQFSQAAVTNKIGVSPKYRHNRVGAVGEEGVEYQEDMAPQAGRPGEPSISSDPQENAPLKVARAWRRRKSEKVTTQRTYFSVLGVHFA